MSRFRKITALIIVIEIVLAVVFNVLLLRNLSGSNSRNYRVETMRVARIVEEGGTINPDDFQYVTSVHEFDPEVKVNSDYIIANSNGKLYQIEYKNDKDFDSLIYLNIGLVSMLVISVCVLVYVETKILKPFYKMSEYSVELAKGNLTATVKEDRNKFFGRFLWGINMLRDNLETNKEKELELQKEKKTLILSISHDIKTPLSAIRLYTKALKANLYDTEEKKQEALNGIESNTSDIEKYVNEIVAASKEDFLNLEVNMGEFYLTDLVKKIATYYDEKFKLLHTEFTVEQFENFLLKGDFDRVEEVIQNMLENAIKYGDGKSVGIYFEQEEDCCLIKVKNSGSSIKDEEIPHLFESFYRGSNSEGVKGSGLGLYICKSLLRLMDGDIYAENVNGEFVCVAVIRMA